MRKVKYALEEEHKEKGIPRACIQVAFTNYGYFEKVELNEDQIVHHLTTFVDRVAQSALADQPVVYGTDRLPPELKSKFSIQEVVVTLTPGKSTAYEVK